MNAFISRTLVLALLLSGMAAFGALAAEDAKAPEAQEESPYVKELREREKEYEALIEEIRQKAPKYANLQYPQPKSAEEIQKILLTDDRTALLEYLVGDKIAVLFVLEKPEIKDGKVVDAGLTVYQLDREKLIEAARKFHASVSNPTSRDYRDLGSALYKLILAPAEARLTGKDRLFVIPDGILFYVPFEALVDGRGQFLINRFSMTYAPSASVLAELYEEHAQRKKDALAQRVAFLGIGDPVFSKDEADTSKVASRGADTTAPSAKRKGKKKESQAEPAPAAPQPAASEAPQTAPAEGSAAGAKEGEQSLDDLLNGMEFSTRGLYEGRGYQFQRIPYTGVEVREAATLFADKKTELLLREAARETAVKERDLTKYDILHFATHGVVDEEVPMRSGVVLSLVDEGGEKKDDKEDGFLQMSEIFNMRLNADLVTLSACQTGLGKIVRGEGMVGLTRAFLYAGTPSVMVSLWNVNDLTTAYLMTSFYKHLEAGQDKTEALRQARRDMANRGVDLGSLQQRLGEMRNAEAKERGFGEVIYEARPAKQSNVVNASHPYYWAAFVLVGHPR